MTDTALVLTIGYCLWAITDRHIPTGILITSGLTLVLCGCLAELDGNAYIDRVISLRTWGLVLVGWGFFWNLTARAWWLNLSMRWHFMHTLARVFGVERRHHRRTEE
jgi:hypothetical protein